MSNIEHQKPNGEWVDCNDAAGRCKLPKRQKRAGGAKGGSKLSGVKTKTKTAPMTEEEIMKLPALDRVRAFRVMYGEEEKRDTGLYSGVTNRFDDLVMEHRDVLHKEGLGEVALHIMVETANAGNMNKDELSEMPNDQWRNLHRMEEVAATDGSSEEVVSVMKNFKIFG